ncbi:MAG: sodium:alanine symporter family protein [Phycisphaeraceae bacterium]|nr:sodium:alanine symporter family protein [Phycisphaeraceae bacterium]
MDLFKSIVDVLEHAVWSAQIPGLNLPWLAVLLLTVGAFLTVRMGFIQFRKLRHAVQIVRGDYDQDGHAGDISHFQALTTALSATVGIGNIAGVAMAIHWGGPGAIFWMWMTALLGMCTKYTEVSLAMKHRDFDEAGNSSGGPQKYIMKGLGSAWKPLAMFFALCAILSSLGAGNMNQINTLAQTVKDSTGIPDWLTGAVAAVLVGFVILGGIQRIGKVTSILAPVMACLYVAGSLIVLGINIGGIGDAFGTILSEAFNPTAGVAGTAAGAWTMTLLWGVKRGLFSNEAGQGSAPIAHAAAKTDEPLREGLVALLEPFIDTIVICTMTALVIITSGLWDEHVETEHELANKDLTVMTWSAGPEQTAISLTDFGRAMGRHDDDPTIELAGYDGPHDDGDTEDADAVDEKLIIAGGRPLRILHADGSTTGVVLVKNNAPIAFAEEVKQDENGDWTGHMIYEVMDGTLIPFVGEVTVNGGAITGGAKDLQLRAGTIKIGAALTAEAFDKALGPLGRLIVTLTVMLFALSTAISWSYYGDRCTEYLFGLRGVMVYKLLFLGFVFMGAILPLQTVWTFGDVALGLMTVPNLIAVIFLSRSVRRMQDEYFSDPKNFNSNRN